MQIVLASNNKGKIKEFQDLFLPLHCEIVPQSHFSVPNAEEPFNTFLENALAKARHAARYTKLPAIADDSGLCVDALNGAPGVHSARFAGEHSTDAENNALLIKRLSHEANLAAHYTCILVGVLSEDDPEPIVAEGRWFGSIALTAKGENGFGYDPYFYVPEKNCHSAELSPEEKNRLSHRGQAINLFLKEVVKRWKIQ